MNDIKLKVNGYTISSFDTFNISNSIFKFVDSFNFIIPGDGYFDIINEQDAVEIYIDDEKKLTGYVFKKNPSIKSQFTIAISGREKTADLVDCSIVNKPSSFKNQNLQKIVYELANPFNYNVIRETDIGDNIKSFSANRSDFVFNSINRICSKQAVLPITNVDGDIVLTNVDGDNDVEFNFRYGENIKDPDYKIDYTSRYSDYIVTNSIVSTGNGWDKNSVALEGVASDEEVTRYRPLLISVDGEYNQQTLNQRASWEAQVRKGRSKIVSFSTPGFTDNSGKLYSVNKMASVTIPKFNINNQKLVISDVQFAQTAKKQITNIVLVDPIIFKAKPQTTLKKSNWSL